MWRSLRAHITNTTAVYGNSVYGWFEYVHGLIFVTACALLWGQCIFCVFTQAFIVGRRWCLSNNVTMKHIWEAKKLTHDICWCLWISISTPDSVVHIEYDRFKLNLNDIYFRYIFEKQLFNPYNYKQRAHFRFSLLLYSYIYWKQTHLQYWDKRVYESVHAFLKEYLVNSPKFTGSWNN